MEVVLFRLQLWEKLRWCDQLPCFAQVLCQLFVTDLVHFDADPATHADVWRPIEFLWRLFDQHLLDANRCWYGHRDVAVVMMVVRKHREHLLVDKPSRFAM